MLRLTAGRDVHGLVVSSSADVRAWVVASDATAVRVAIA
jgi:hypothetical protein